MARTNGGSPKARVIGAELRKAREERGLGVRELARKLGTDHTKLVRCENGRTTPTPEYVASVLTALGVPEAERERVINIARGVEQTNWLASVVPSAHHELTTLIEFERSASQITEISTMVVPGLLQTRNYARAVMASLPPGELETRITLRVGRREILNGTSAPEFEVLIMQSALRTPIGGRLVMADQLRHIAHMAAKSNVTVRIIPDSEDWHPAHAGSFILFQFPAAAPIVHLEHYSADVFLHEPPETDAYLEATDTLRRLSLSEDQSTELIIKAAEEMEK
ncbi:helix-turn-helix domain-containing protein [Saccharopolyspora sp. 6T]|uniref:helix-turn-helix domain-containing protein n=1 Tax=Saccharopolyspora sp. 6T TaxID=2877238 RepID=UPI001CD1B0E8|nr:helix-turn-helix transcriptional regulator [Saccharopolyspora sp. 6T]MCA1190320.1 helix-turn-helix domain-containing protein [Saccharopolyspora sp. 6T]